MVRHRDSIPVAQALGAQLGALEDRGTILVDTSTLGFDEPYTGYLFAELRRGDIDVVVEDDTDVRQFGARRRADGRTDLRVWLIQGRDIDLRPLPAGVERIASVRALDGGEASELAPPAARPGDVFADP